MKYEEMNKRNIDSGLYSVASFVSGPDTYEVTSDADRDDACLSSMNATLRVYDIHEECTCEHPFRVEMETDYAIDFNVIGCFRNYLEEADQFDKMDLMEIIQGDNALEIDTTDPDGNPITLNVMPEL